MDTSSLYADYIITGMVSGVEPIEIANAYKSTIIDKTGKKYIDCFAGIAVSNVGHNNSGVIAAAKAQIERFIHCGTYLYYSDKAGELAELLAKITPGKLQKSFFGNGGAEAIEGALRIARQYSGKREFISHYGGFHGRSNMALSITGNRERKRRGGHYASGVAFVPAPYLYRCPFSSTTDEECAARTAQFFRDSLRYNNSGDVAAFIAEPVMGEGGIIVPHESYFKHIKTILDEEDILFIADEVQSGFGRTGKMFAIEHYGVEPDIMTMAKGIAGGFPLSAFIVKPEIAEAFKPGDHLSTFGGNPVSCAAAIATISALYNDGLIDNSLTLGKKIIHRLSQLLNTSAITGDVRGKGLMIGIELVTDRKTKSPNPKAANFVRTYCRENGILVGIGGINNSVVRIQPPLCLTDEEAEKALSVLEKAILAAEKRVE